MLLEFSKMAKRFQCAAAVLSVVLLCVALTEQVEAYQLTRKTFLARQQCLNRVSNTALYGLLGRFRKNRKVEQVTTIKVGDKLPVGVDVERILTTSENGEQLSEPVAIQDVLGANKALLVGTYYEFEYATFAYVCLRTHFECKSNVK